MQTTLRPWLDPSATRSWLQIGVTGLAVMGRNLARNFARHGHRVAIHNRTYAKTQSLIDDHGVGWGLHPERVDG